MIKPNSTSRNQELKSLLILTMKMMLKLEVLSIKQTKERRDKDFYQSKKRRLPVMQKKKPTLSRRWLQSKLLSYLFNKWPIPTPEILKKIRMLLNVVRSSSKLNLISVLNPKQKKKNLNFKQEINLHIKNLRILDKKKNL